MTDKVFEQAVREHANTVFRVAYHAVKDRPEAEDVTQTVLLRLYQYHGDFQSGDHLKHWLLRVAVNECRRLLRSPWRRRTGPLEEAGETAVFDRPAQTELFRQVMSLPPKYRAAVYLHYYEGYPVKETAALLGTNTSTVQTWLMRARGQLQTKLKEAEAYD